MVPEMVFTGERPLPSTTAVVKAWKFGFLLCQSVTCFDMALQIRRSREDFLLAGTCSVKARIFILANLV